MLSLQRVETNDATDWAKVNSGEATKYSSSFKLEMQRSLM